MGKTVRIEVTADDIANGQREMACSCPVGRALGRTFAGKVVGVWQRLGGDLVIGEDDEHPLAFTPVSVRRFVRDFDRGEPVEPFSFELELP